MNTFTKILISDDGRHHIFLDNSETYNDRFDRVLSYHLINNEYQVAPVSRDSQAWHIDENGQAIYAYTFDRTFGFYCNLAAVVKGDDWFHITPDGKAAYPERYCFVGNFQEGVAVVCNKNEFYFHINKSGMPIYEKKWAYCGDFREGVAVVQDVNGLSTHINSKGKFIHSQWFCDLDVFHKGYARAKNNKGWYHIDKSGTPIYEQNYAAVEPFYNGCARVETHDGALQIISENGEIIRELRTSQLDAFANLSSDLVGYWRTFTITAAVKLNIFDYLPSTISKLASKTSTIEVRLLRLLNALGELDLIENRDNQWKLLPKAKYLTSEHPNSLATAAMEYSEELMDRWRNLVPLMQTEVITENIFQKVATNKEHTKNHHKMLRSYALKDYQPLISKLDIESGDIVFDAAGGDGVLADLIQREFLDSNVILGDLIGVIELSDFKNKLSFDLFSFNDWPEKINKVILARVLHDWNDDDASKILLNASHSLCLNGVIYIFEMLLDDKGFDGSLCDLHLLTVTGGQERTREQYSLLFEKAGLFIEEEISSESLVTVMKLRRK